MRIELRIIIEENIVLYVKKEEIDVNARVSRLGGQNEGIKIIRRRIARDTVVNRLSRFCPEAELRTAHDLLAYKLSFVHTLRYINIIIIIVGSRPNTYISCIYHTPRAAAPHSSIT